MHKQVKQSKQNTQYRTTNPTDALQKKAKEQLATIQDNRPSTIAQTKLWNSIHKNSADTQSQGSFQFKSNFSNPQKPLQYKEQTAQRIAEEQEEDLLQGKFRNRTAPIQKMVESEEEEDLLQGKFKTPAIQRQAIENEEELLQGKFSQEPIQEQTQKTNFNKTGLPTQLKSGIENLSGISMDDVSVHYNSSKPTQLQAHAYAQGTDIHLASGQEKHLPHEAWHVVQQKQGRVKPTTQLKGINVNDDVGLEKEADVMGAKANSLQLKKDEKTISKQGIQNNATAQMVMTPHIVLNKAHLREVKGGKIQSKWFRKTKVGDQIPYNTEIQADKTATFEKGAWLKAKHGGHEGAIRATKVVEKQVMSGDQIDSLSEETPKSDKLEAIDKVADVGGKILGKDEDVYEKLSKQDKKTDVFENDTIEATSKGTALGNIGLGALGDLTGMFLSGRKLRTTWKEKSWDWDLAATGLKILKSGASLVDNISQGVSAASKMITGASKKSKTPADTVSSIFGQISGSVSVLKSLLDVILSLTKMAKKGKGKDTAKYFKNVGSLGKNMLKLLAKFQKAVKKSTAYKVSVPFLSAIISGAEAVMAWLKIGESKEQAKDMSDNSRVLRQKIILALGQGKVNGRQLFGNKSDADKVLHAEKRGLMGYRKNYFRVNPAILTNMDSLCQHAKIHLGKRKQELLVEIGNFIEKTNRTDKLNENDHIQKDKICDLIKNMKNFNEGKTKLEALKKDQDYKSLPVQMLLYHLVPHLKEKSNLLEASLETKAKKVTTNQTVKENLVRLASQSSTHHKLFEIQKLLKEYELVDKLSEINQKRASVGSDTMWTSIISVIGELTGSISGFFTAGAGAVAGKVVSGVGSAYKGTRSAGKFAQKHIGRKFGLFGGDKSRSKDAKHKEYVHHAKSLTKMWIDETDKTDLDAAKASLDKKQENPAAGLKKVKSYIDATGLKTQDAVEAPAMQIPDMIVDALKERT